MRSAYTIAKLPSSELTVCFPPGIGLLLLVVLAVTLPVDRAQSAFSAGNAPVPNIIIILADDMGYSDLGCYGGEIQTPNLDGLARDGLRFTQFYNTARCWPTRGAIMTGYYAQEIRRDTVPGIRSGGRGVRPDWAPLLPAMLGPLGYRSYHSGKWHIDGWPLKNGFDRSYDLRDQGRFFSPRVHYEDGKKLPPVQRGSGYYATIRIADYAIQCLKDHAQNFPDRPFFQYIAFTAPHFPLQALQQDIDRYRGRYDCGWAEIRKQRYRRMKKMGIVRTSLSAVERNLGPPYDFPEALKILGPGEVKFPLPWDQLTEEQRHFQATKMSIHAAMIDRMDREIGRILAQLRAMDAFRNTVIFFLSDNGASAEIMVRNDGHDPTATPGSAATHLCLGPGWSTTCNTPFRRHKTWVHEGGISTPLIVHWPARITDKGQLRRNPGHVVDLVPTILELAGGKPPTSWKGTPRPDAPGKSLVRVFQKDRTVTHDYLWWLHEDNRAIRVGDWKLVAEKGGDWELYDLSTDRAESDNRVTQLPDRAAQLKRQWERAWEKFEHLAKQKLPPTRQTKSKNK